MPRLNPPFETHVRLKRLSKKHSHIAVQKLKKGRWVRLAVYNDEAEAIARLESELECIF